MTIADKIKFHFLLLFFFRLILFLSLMLLSFSWRPLHIIVQFWETHLSFKKTFLCYLIAKTLRLKKRKNIRFKIQFFMLCERVNRRYIIVIYSLVLHYSQPIILFLCLKINFKLFYAPFNVNSLIPR